MQADELSKPVAKRDSKRMVIKLIQSVVLFGLLIYFLPWLLVFYLICGGLDLWRNAPLDWATVKRYFLGNGWLTWLLSPFNLLLDLFTSRNKRIYQLTDLPQAYQTEINTLLQAIDRQGLIDELADKMGDKNRGMMFFKWYGKNIHNSVSIPEFHQNYQFVRTIGVSMFNKQQSTSLHFGPMRVTLRVLYNLNPIDSDDVYIQVGQHRNVWREQPLFIFDDTLQHQSVNGSDQQRYCMFIDILRPSAYPAFIDRILNVVRLISLRVNHVFYKNWDFIK
ncbi:MAG: aspartyl/asparaginyl beta-hydroxylase domain-containing protein [Legionellales bacterium]|nr:aspartyl/asparaginyl beta-hydroxylase domain-containing protein [Legionellales bacterium]